jgi:hypothetical protein
MTAYKPHFLCLSVVALLTGCVCVCGGAGQVLDAESVAVKKTRPSKRCELLKAMVPVSGTSITLLRLKAAKAGANVLVVYEFDRRERRRAVTTVTAYAYRCPSTIPADARDDS